jgi:hypothetical protein
MTKILSTLLLPFCLVFVFSCGKKTNPTKALIEEKKSEAKIKELLTGCQVNISEIDSTLPQTDSVKLDKTLVAFSSSIGIFVRNRGVLLEDNQVVTSLNIRVKTQSGSAKKTYIGLFNGREKKLLSSVFIGSHVDVISITKESDSTTKESNSITTVDALIREPGKPASKIQTFKVKTENNIVSLIQ